MVKRSAWLLGMAWILCGCALEPLQYKQPSAPPPIGTVCLKTNYFDPCVYIRSERLRSDPQLRMLLGGDPR